MKKSNLLFPFLFFGISSFTAHALDQESGESVFKPSASKLRCSGRKCPTPEGLRLDLSYDSDLKILTEESDGIGIKSSGRRDAPNGGLTVKLVKQKKFNRSFRLIYGAQAQYAKYRKSYYSESDSFLDPNLRFSREANVFSTTSLENFSVGAPVGVEWHFRMLWNSFHFPLYAVPQYKLYSSEKVNSCEFLNCTTNFENEDEDFSYSVNIGLAMRYENVAFGVYSSSTRFFGSNDVIFRSTRAQLGYYF